MGHRGGAGLLRTDAEPAGKSEAVEHFLSFGEKRHERPVVALVEIESALVAASQIDVESKVMFPDFHQPGRVFSQEHPRGGFESFPGACLSVRPLVDSPDRQECVESFGNLALPSVGAGREKLADEILTVPVDDETGKAVRFGIHEPECRDLSACAKGFTHPDGPFKAVSEKSRRDLFMSIKGPQADADLGVRREGAPGKPGAVGGDDIDGVTRRERLLRRLYRP